MFDLLFAQFRFWRHFKGGLWWKITHPIIGESRWVRQEPRMVELICGYENYTKHPEATILPTSEFYEKITMISRNSQWKDELNLSKYLKAAGLLRSLGLDDHTTITILTDLYWASSREVDN